MPAADIIHAIASTGNDPANLVAYILQFGVVGLLLLDIGVTRKVFVPRWTLDREEQERERERIAYEERIVAQAGVIEKLMDLQRDQVVPALTRATDIAKDYVQILQSNQRDRRSG